MAVVLVLLNARPFHKASPAYSTHKNKIPTSSTNSGIEKRASPWLSGRECGACQFDGAVLHFRCSWRSEDGLLLSKFTPRSRRDRATIILLYACDIIHIRYF